MYHVSVVMVVAILSLGNMCHMAIRNVLIIKLVIESYFILDVVYVMISYQRDT